MVPGAKPVLLPTAISSTWSAQVTELGTWFFDVIYTSPDATQTVELAIVVPNPPPPGVNGSQAQPKFHGDVHSLYQISDKTQATSERFLMWNEPGTWTQANGMAGVPYPDCEGADRYAVLGSGEFVEVGAPDRRAGSPKSQVASATEV